MLEDLTIKDFALIDETVIEFNRGFTVLSGETGAGKSILIGALSFLLGGKASAEQIRSGATEACVTGTFLLPEKKPSDRIFSGEDPDFEPASAWEWLSMHGIECENDRVILRRLVRAGGKTGAWISGVPVTRVDLAAFSSFLVDIHGQHEHQSLMKVSEHRKFLDMYAGISDEVAGFTKMYSELVDKRKNLASINSSNAEKNRRMEYLSFSINEIEEASLKNDEDVGLEAEEARLSSFEKLYSEVQMINTMLTGSEESSMLSLFKRFRAASERASSLDKSIEGLDSRIQNLFYELSDISDEFRSYEAGLVFDPSRLEEVQQRLDLIYKLKKKYASSPDAPLSEVFSYLEESKKELENLSSSEENKAVLEKQVAELELNVYKTAKEISRKRAGSAENMAKSVEMILSSLGMKSTRFSVSLQNKEGNDVEQRCGPYGMDDIEFLICANPGAPMMPLAKIASGGELSRVMLALKTIFASVDPVATLVFDEIDTGIGGEVAVAVGSHMRELAKNRQILCITHLASIAVYADNQIKIQKNIVGGLMKTNAGTVSGEARVQEIARMLSGDSNSEESLDHARSMLRKFSDGGIQCQK